jgi:hypothetical protein
MDNHPPPSIEDYSREDSPHDHPGDPSANDLCSSSSSRHCGSSTLSLPPCSRSGEPCPSTPLFAPPPRPATQVSSLVVSLRLKRSAWQDKIFSVKVLIEALTGQRIIDANILSPRCSRSSFRRTNGTPWRQSSVREDTSTRRLKLSQ